MNLKKITLMTLMTFLFSSLFSQAFAVRLVCKEKGQRAALYNVTRGEYVDHWYTTGHEKCRQIVAHSPFGLTCQASRNGLRFALYNSWTGEVIEPFPFHTKTLDECVETLKRSRQGLTCVTKRRSSQAAMYDFYNDRMIDRFYNRTLEQCLAALP